MNRFSMAPRASASSGPSVSTRMIAPGSAASSMMFMMLLALARMPSLMKITELRNLVAVSTIRAAGRAWMPESLITVSSLLTIGSGSFPELDRHGGGLLPAGGELDVPHGHQHRPLVDAF